MILARHGRTSRSRVPASFSKHFPQLKPYGFRSRGGTDATPYSFWPFNFESIIAPHPWKFRYGLVVVYDRLVIDNLNQLHHAAVLMSQDVAMVDELAGKVGKVGPHFDIAGLHLISRFIQYLAARNREGVPPDPWLGKLERLRHAFFRFKDFNDLEWVHVYVKWMQDILRFLRSGCIVLNHPFLARVQKHSFIDPAFLKPPAVDERR